MSENVIKEVSGNAEVAASSSNLDFSAAVAETGLQQSARESHSKGAAEKISSLIGSLDIVGAADADKVVKDGSDCGKYKTAAAAESAIAGRIPSRATGGEKADAINAVAAEESLSKTEAQTLKQNLENKYGGPAVLSYTLEIQGSGNEHKVKAVRN